LNVLREWNPNLFDSFVKGLADHNEVISAFRELDGSAEFFLTRRGKVLEATLAAGADEFTKSDKAYQEYAKLAVEATSNVEEARAAEILRIIQSKNQISPFTEGVGMKYTLKRLELGQRFVVQSPDD